MGLITSIGNDRETVTRNLLELRHGIENPPELQVDSSPVKVAGTVKGFEVDSTDPEDWVYPEQYRVPRATLRSFSPHVLYAWCALSQAIEDAGLSQDDLHDPDAGLYTSSGGSMRSIHKHFEKMDQRGVMACNPLAIVASIAGTLTFNLVAALGIRGSSTGLVSACASSGHALGMALDEIRLGRQKRMLVVGAEDCNFESIVPFCGMRALSLEADPNHASRPFDLKRNGFVGTGGAVCLVLETESEARRRGSTPYARLFRMGSGLRRTQRGHFPSRRQGTEGLHEQSAHGCPSGSFLHRIRQRPRPLHSHWGRLRDQSPQTGFPRSSRSCGVQHQGPHRSRTFPFQHHGGFLLLFGFERRIHTRIRETYRNRIPSSSTCN